MTPYSPFPAYADWSLELQILAFRMRCPGMGPGLPLIIGHSLTNQLAYNTACGKWLVKFAVNGARVHDFLAYVEEIIDIVQPSDVVIAPLGDNDFVQPELSMGPQSNFWYFEQDYFNLAKAFKDAGKPPVLMTILPTESSLTSGPLVAHNNPTKLKQYNDYIKACGLPVNLNLPVQDACAALAGPDGYLPAGSTYDGVHPMGALNAPLWAQYVAALRTSRAARGITADDTLAMIP